MRKHRRVLHSFIFFLSFFLSFLLFPSLLFFPLLAIPRGKPRVKNAPAKWKDSRERGREREREMSQPRHENDFANDRFVFY